MSPQLFDLYQTLGPLQNHFGHLNMIICRFVKGGTDDFTFNRSLHIRNFFRTFVNKKYN